MKIILIYISFKSYPKYYHFNMQPIQKSLRYFTLWRLQNLGCILYFVCACSVVSDSATPWIVARQAPLSMEFSKQEYWSGLPFPSPETLLDPGIKPMSSASPALADGFFITEPPGKSHFTLHHILNQHRRIDAFELWYWRRLLRIPWTQGDSTSPF